MLMPPLFARDMMFNGGILRHGHKTDLPKGVITDTDAIIFLINKYHYQCAQERKVPVPLSYIRKAFKEWKEFNDPMLLSTPGWFTRGSYSSYFTMGSSGGRRLEGAFRQAKEAWYRRDGKGHYNLTKEGLARLELLYGACA